MLKAIVAKIRNGIRAALSVVAAKVHFVDCQVKKTLAAVPALCAEQVPAVLAVVKKWRVMAAVVVNFKGVNASARYAMAWPLVLRMTAIMVFVAPAALSAANANAQEFCFTIDGNRQCVSSSCQTTGQTTTCTTNGVTCTTTFPESPPFNVVTRCSNGISCNVSINQDGSGGNYRCTNGVSCDISASGQVNCSVGNVSCQANSNGIIACSNGAVCRLSGFNLSCQDTPTSNPQPVPVDCAAQHRIRTNPTTCGGCMSGYFEDSLSGMCTQIIKDCAALNREQYTADSCNICLDGYIGDTLGFSECVISCEEQTPDMWRPSSTNCACPGQQVAYLIENEQGRRWSCKDFVSCPGRMHYDSGTDSCRCPHEYPYRDSANRCAAVPPQGQFDECQRRDINIDRICGSDPVGQCHDSDLDNADTALTCECPSGYYRLNNRCQTIRDFVVDGAAASRAHILDFVDWSTFRVVSRGSRIVRRAVDDWGRVKELFNFGEKLEELTNPNISARQLSSSTRGCLIREQVGFDHSTSIPPVGADDYPSCATVFPNGLPMGFADLAEPATFDTSCDSRIRNAAGECLPVARAAQIGGGGGGGGGGGSGLAIGAGAVVVLGLAYFIFADGDADAFTFNPQASYSMKDGVEFYRYGSRLEFRKDEWTMWWTADQSQGGNSSEEFRYGFGGRWTGEFLQAEAGAEAAEDSADVRGLLRTEWELANWTVRPSYRFTASELEEKWRVENALDLSAEMHQAGWRIRPSVNANLFGDSIDNDANFRLRLTREF